MSISRLERIKEMLKEEPEDGFLNYALALEHIAMNDFPEAIRIIEGIIQRDEDYLGAYYQLGKLYELSNQPKESIGIYKKGIVIAKRQKNQKTQGELKEALMLLEEG